MKTIKFNIVIFSLFIFICSCKAQTLPLITAVNNIPNNAQIKDLNNELSLYIGTYKANFQEKEITLFITKEENKLEVLPKKQFYRDALVIKYIVTNSLGQVLQDTVNNSTNIELYSTRPSPSQNNIIFYYGGTNCGVGWGNVYLKKLNATQISWEYRPDDIILDSSRCLSGTDITIYLPETKDLIFTKQ